MPSVEKIPRLPILPTDLGHGDTINIGWMLYQPRNIENPPPISPEQRLFWTTTVLSLDLALENENNPATSEFLTRFERKRKTFKEHYDKLLWTTQMILNQDPSVRYEGLAFGAFPGMCDIWNDEKTNATTKSNMHSLIVANTEEAHIKIPNILSLLPPEFGKRTLLLYDDVADTCGVIALLVEEVEEQLGKDQDSNRLSKILTNTADTPYKKYKDYYRELAVRIEENGILLAISVYKNQPFFESMSNYVKRALNADPHNVWAIRQKRLLDAAIHMDQYDWLMGLGMDTSIKGKDVLSDLTELDPSIVQNSAVAHLLVNCDQWKLRIGSTVHTLIALKQEGSKAAIDPFKQWVYGEINRRLQNIASRR